MKELKRFRAESMKSWLFLMTAALIITACSSDDIAVDDEPQPADTPVTYTLSIDATRTPDADLTRALALEDKTLNATWTATDVVAVMKNTSIDTPDGPQSKWAIVGYLKPANISSDGLSCTLSGSITGSIATGDKLQLVYPGQEGVEVDDGNDGESQSQDFSIVYLNQDGTFAKLAKEYDYCRTPQWGNNMVKVIAVDGTSITTSAATFTSNQAIVKFILTDKNGNAVNAKELTIDAVSRNGEGSHQLSFCEPLTEPNPEGSGGILKIYPSGGSNEVYAALSGVSDCKVFLTAKDGYNSYEYEKSGVTFTHGKYYVINVKMTKTSTNVNPNAQTTEPNPEPNSTSEPSLNVNSEYMVGQYIGSDGKFYPANATFPSGVTKVAVIAYVGSDSNCAHGLAIALSDDGGATSWGDAVLRAANHQPTILNAVWRLPSMTDLQHMFKEWRINGDYNDDYIDDLHMPNKQLFKSQGFVNFLQTAGAAVARGTDDRYWTSSHTSYSGWSYSFNTFRFYACLQTKSYRVRAVLAF